MQKRGDEEWIFQPKIKQVLLLFSTPRTPKKVEKELCLKKLKIGPYWEKGLIQPLNPEARKGRLYILTDKARKLLKIPCVGVNEGKDWDLIGWVMASPKQRLVVLKTMALDSVKRSSEDIRRRASGLNPCLTRISTKGILKELIDKGLVETEMRDRRRYYWISEKGIILGLVP